jgi:hypothetical protein
MSTSGTNEGALPAQAVLPLNSCRPSSLQGNEAAIHKEGSVFHLGYRRWLDGL